MSKKWLIVVMMAALAAMVVGVQTAGAVAWTWDGGGGDGNFSTDTNWDSDADFATVFVPGTDTIVFPDYNYAVDQQPSADVAMTGIVSMSFDTTTSTISLTLGANLTMQTGGSITATGANGVTLSPGAGGLIAGGTLIIDNDDASGLYIVGTLTGNVANLITFSGSQNITVSGNIIDGTGTPITVAMDASTDIVTFSGANTFSGPLTLTQGELVFSTTSSDGAPSAFNLNGGILTLNAAFNNNLAPATITLGGAATIKTATGASVLNNSIDGAATLTFDGSQNLTISGVIGVGGDATILIVNMDAVGQVLTLSGVNVYTGLVTLTQGTLRLGSTTAFGTGAGGLSLGGGILQLGTAINSGAWTPAITLTGPATIDADVAGSEIDTAITNGANTLTVTGGENLTLSGILGAGAGGLTINMDAVTDIIRLTAANTYTGATTITAGTLLYNTAMNAACTGAIGVASGAAIGGTGTIVGAVTVASGGFLRAGDGAVGTLTAGDVTFVGTAKMYVDIVAAAKDLLDVNGTLVLPAGTALVELEAGSTPNASTAYQVITPTTYNSGAGANVFATTSLPAGWTITSTDNTTVTLNSSAAAPVPTLNEWGVMIAMLLLAGAAVMVMRKRQMNMAA